MRRIVCLAVALAVVAASAARADEKADAKALIEKAIKAAGGEAKLAKFQTVTFKGKGKLYAAGQSEDYSGEWWVHYPDKMREAIDAQPDFSGVRVVNGDKLWVKVGANTLEVDNKDAIQEAKDNLYAEGVASLVPLLKGEGYEFAPLAEAKVADKPAVGVRVSNKGHRDVSLFFNKDSGLLVKSETVIKDETTGGKEVTQETLYSDYKEFGGAKRPTKIVINRDGKKHFDVKISTLVPKAKLDEKLFGKP